MAHEITNEARSLAEVARFNTEIPERYFAYVKLNGNLNHGIVTTWIGDPLGEATLGIPYKLPAFGGFPSIRQSIRIKAINGREYYGTYYCSSGDYCRLRLVKIKSLTTTRAPSSES